MASFFNNNAFSTASLSPDQQALLLAALTANQNQQANGGDTSTTPREVFDFASGSMENPMFSNGSISGFSQPDFNSLTDQQFLDYIGRSNSFDVDAVAPEDTLESPTNDDSNYDLHDKRKSPGSDEEDDSEDDDENSAKRRESDGKVAKKPGRKPLTTEPTTVSINLILISNSHSYHQKRKAQNRAAQRAFRERKERHLKDLETKVAELEKSSESANHENGLLRAQVDKLTGELKEYRKRLSVQSIRTSPQAGNIGSLSSTSMNGLGNTFNFDIPQFGSPSPYAQLFNGNRSSTMPSVSSANLGTFDLSTALLQRADSTARSPSTQAPTPAMSEFIKSPHNSISADSPQNRTGSTTSFFNTNRENNVSNPPESPSAYNIFTSPSTGAYEPNTAPTSNTARSDSGASSTRVFQFRSGSSPGSTTSPGSNYNAGASSSCGTSPEPSGPGNMTAKEASLQPINEKDGKGLEKGEISAANSISVLNSISTPATSTILDSVMITEEPTDQSYDLFSLAGQAKDPFAPMSWVDYGDNSMNMFGESSFAGNSYMNDFSSSFNLDVPMSWNDLTGSSRTGLTPAVQKKNPMESNAKLDPMMEEIRAQVAADPKKLVPCHKIWYVSQFSYPCQSLTAIRDKIQDRADFKDGTLDIDGLCNELRQKAKCSENGVVIDQKDVDAALHRLPPTTASPSTS